MAGDCTGQHSDCGEHAHSISLSERVFLEQLGLIPRSPLHRALDMIAERDALITALFLDLQNEPGLGETLVKALPMALAAVGPLSNVLSKRTPSTFMLEQLTSMKQRDDSVPPASFGLPPPATTEEKLTRLRELQQQIQEQIADLQGLSAVPAPPPVQRT